MSVRLSVVKDLQFAKPAPFISFSGDWLLEAGFEVGKKLVIEVKEKGEIIIKVVEGVEL